MLPLWGIVGGWDPRLGIRHQRRFRPGSNFQHRSPSVWGDGTGEGKNDLGALMMR